MPPREDVKARIVEFSKAHFPKEACGFVVRIAEETFQVLDCANTHANPFGRFRISGGDWTKAEQLGTIVAVWHSEPNVAHPLSAADKTMAEELETPYIAYAIPADQWEYYEPSGWRHELGGRPFVHGILDCFSTARDYYRTAEGIEIPNYQREDGWWRLEKHPDLFMRNFESAGFVRVDDELRRSDGILMSTHHLVVNHCGVYLGNGMMLHHPPLRASTIRPYIRSQRGDFYVASTVAIVRHRSLIDRK